MTLRGAALTGDLAVFRPELVFQLVSMARLEGLLALEADGRTCRVFFRDGQVIWAEAASSTSAETAVQRARGVIDEVLQWRAGTFRFENGVRAAHRDGFLDVGLEQLLLESMERHDRSRHEKGA